MIVNYHLNQCILSMYLMDNLWQGKPAISTLLGKLMFLRPDSIDEAVRSEHLCLLSAVFISWDRDQALVISPILSWNFAVYRQSRASA
jgi:hypothetical protein